MSDKEYTAGFFPNCPPSNRAGHLRVFAWMAPEFGQWDPEIHRRPKLYPIRSILIERNVTEETIGKPRVIWSNGDEIPIWKWRAMRLSMQRRIERAITDSLRIAGAGRKR